MRKLLIVAFALALANINSSSAAYHSTPVARVFHVPDQLNQMYFSDIPEYVLYPFKFYLNNGDEPENTSDSSVTEPYIPQTNTITLSFAGDCTLGTDESFKGNTFNAVYEKMKDPSYFFRGVFSVFSEDDFTLVNLEGALTKATKKAEKKYRYKGDPSYVEILVKGGVEGVTLANNHTLDYLEAGFEDTINTLNEAGILYTYFETCFIKEIKGMKIGFLGYKGWSHEKKSNMLLTEQVKKMREQGVNYIVVNYHWGDMKSYMPNEAQKRMAHFAIDNGADLVIGHHPHVLQGVEKYKGKNIVYSLGNFCYGGSLNPADKDTIIYQQILTFDTGRNEIINSEYRIIPAMISSEKHINNYQPIIATGSEGERILEKFEALSKALDN